MTKLEYLMFLSSKKGFLFKEESRLDEMLEEDKEILLKYRYIDIEDGMVSLTDSGERYLASLE